MIKKGMIVISLLVMLICLFLSTPSTVHFVRMFFLERKILESVEVYQSEGDCIRYDVNRIDMGLFMVIFKIKVPSAENLRLLNGISVRLAYSDGKVEIIENVYGGTLLPDNDGYYSVFLWKAIDGGLTRPLLKVVVCPPEAGWPVDGVVEYVLSAGK